MILFAEAFQAICAGDLPFMRFSIITLQTTYYAGWQNSSAQGIPEHETPLGLDGLVYWWFKLLLQTYGDPEPPGTAPFLATELLGTALFFANEALVSETAAVTPLTARRIYSSPGRRVVKPAVSFPAKIVISALIFVQVLALLPLCAFIYSVPTFGSRISAASMLIMGAQLKGESAVTCRSSASLVRTNSRSWSALMACWAFRARTSWRWMILSCLVTCLPQKWTRCKLEAWSTPLPNVGNSTAYVRPRPWCLSLGHRE